MVWSTLSRSTATLAHAASGLHDAVDALHGWLSRGGFLPEAWERPFGVGYGRNRVREAVERARRDGAS